MDDAAIMGVHVADRHRLLRFLDLLADPQRQCDKRLFTPLSVPLRVDDDHLVAVGAVMDRLVQDVLEGVEVLPPFPDQQPAAVPLNVQDDHLLRFLHGDRGFDLHAGEEA